MPGDRPASVWRPSGDARPLVCWRDAQMRALSQALDHALAAWIAAWGLQEMAPVSCGPADVLDTSSPWRRLHESGSPAGWLQGDLHAAERVGALLFPASRAAGQVAAGIAARCEEDAIARVLAALDLPGATVSSGSPDASGIGPWAGGVFVHIPPPLAWRLLLEANAMDAWCRRHGLVGAVPPSMPTEPLTCAIDAAAALPIKLGVELAGCELDLGALQRLQPGDVVRVQHRIDAPATVTDTAGLPLFRAYLGRRAGSRAVELAPLQDIHNEAVGAEEQS